MNSPTKDEEELPKVVDMPREVSDYVKPAPVKPALNKDQIGHNLTLIIIIIISVVFLASIIELHYINKHHQAMIDKSIEFIKAIDDKKISKEKKIEKIQALSEIISKSELDTKLQRDSLLEIMKTILVNIILPILTAIMGYTLGKNKDEEK